jgi:hypothetical protein
MGIGAILILLGIILAIINVFVAHRHLLTSAVVLIGIGALIGGTEVL